MKTKKLIICSLVVFMTCSWQTYARDSPDSSPDVKTIESGGNISKNVEGKTNFFKHGFSYGSGLNLDLKTGNSPYAPNLPTNLYSRENVKSFKVISTIYKNNIPNETIRIYNYQNGLLISSYYSASDIEPNETYEYDILGRRIKEGRDFVFTYSENRTSDEIERTVYYKGNYHSTEKIRLLDNGYEVYIRQANGRESSRKFVYGDGLLKQIIQTNITEGREWDWFDFEYEDGLLKEIVNATSKKDDIRSIIKILSYDGSYIMEMESQRFRQGHIELTEIWKFMNYDKYGNWQDAESYSDGVLKQKYHRDIEYN